MGRAFLASVFRSTSFVDCFSTMADLDNLSADMDAANLYTEEIVTDRKMGTIHVLTPITPEGAKDPTRAPIFTGKVQIMTQMGPLPISFDIPAASVAETVAKYGEAAKEGVRQTLERLQEMRREAASKIVTPGSPGFGVPPSSGKIQMP